ncbi:Ig-like domain-containing protein [Paenibacillus albidus]|uniref:Ig-like domain-containing protein n=1 Tax=Paenibacillus albidus TaxID=2041023 RepID=UPI001BE895C9|nr:Ig-like domain-containing protein [Paenibacillus albidus]
MGVEWDSSNIEFYSPGIYTVNGTVKQKVYAEPVSEANLNIRINVNVYRKG